MDLAAMDSAAVCNGRDVWRSTPGRRGPLAAARPCGGTTLLLVVLLLLPLIWAAAPTDPADLTDLAASAARADPADLAATPTHPFVLTDHTDLPASDPEPRLLSWLASRRFPFAASNVSVSRFSPARGGRRGLRARAPLARGDTVLSVPRRFFMSRASARTSRLGEVIRALEGTISDKWLLTVHLLYEYLDPASQWRPYLDTIPAPDPTGSSHAIFWSDTDLAQLQCSEANECPVVTRVRRDRDKAQLVYEQLAPLMTSYFPPQQQRDPKAATVGGGFSWNNFAWAYSTVKARCFTINVTATYGTSFRKADPSLPEGLMSLLVPVGDLFNHHNSVPALQFAYEFDDEQDALVVYADQKYDAGDEVFISYGILTNPDLLLSYGFILPDNAYETAGFRLGLNSQGQREQRPTPPLFSSPTGVPGGMPPTPTPTGLDPTLFAMAPPPMDVLRGDLIRERNLDDALETHISLDGRPSPRFLEALRIRELKVSDLIESEESCGNQGFGGGGAVGSSIGSSRSLGGCGGGMSGLGRVPPPPGAPGFRPPPPPGSHHLGGFPPSPWPQALPRSSAGGSQHPDFQMPPPAPSTLGAATGGVAGVNIPGLSPGDMDAQLKEAVEQALAGMFSGGVDPVAKDTAAERAEQGDGGVAPPNAPPGIRKTAPESPEIAKARAAANGVDFSFPIGGANEFAAYSVLLQGAEALLKQHPTTLLQDLALLGRRPVDTDTLPVDASVEDRLDAETAWEDFAPPHGRPSSRATQAIMMRIETKRILHAVVLECLHGMRHSYELVAAERKEELESEAAPPEGDAYIAKMETKRNTVHAKMRAHYEEGSQKWDAKWRVWRRRVHRIWGGDGDDPTRRSAALDAEGMLNANAARTEQIVSALLKKGFSQAMQEEGEGDGAGAAAAAVQHGEDDPEEEMRIQDLLRFSRIWDGVAEDEEETVEL